MTHVPFNGYSKGAGSSACMTHASFSQNKARWFVVCMTHTPFNGYTKMVLVRLRV